MFAHPHYEPIRYTRTNEEYTQNAIKAVVANYRAGLISRFTAATQLRSAGSYEAEIASLLA